METREMRQTKSDQSRKQVAIAPIHDTGDQPRIDGTSFFDWGMVDPSDQRREHNTLCHRLIALWSSGDSSGLSPHTAVVCAILYT
jgi:hypothetical protein